MTEVIDVFSPQGRLRRTQNKTAWSDANEPVFLYFEFDFNVERVRLNRSFALALLLRDLVEVVGLPRERLQFVGLRPHSARQATLFLLRFLPSQYDTHAELVITAMRALWQEEELVDSLKEALEKETTMTSVAAPVVAAFSPQLPSDVIRSTVIPQLKISSSSSSSSDANRNTVVPYLSLAASSESSLPVRYEPVVPVAPPQSPRTGRGIKNVALLLKLGSVAGPSPTTARDVSAQETRVVVDPESPRSTTGRMARPNLLNKLKSMTTSVIPPPLSPRLNATSLLASTAVAGVESPRSSMGHAPPRSTLLQKLKETTPQHIPHDLSPPSPPQPPMTHDLVLPYALSARVVKSESTLPEISTNPLFAPTASNGTSPLLRPAAPLLQANPLFFAPTAAPHATGAWAPTNPVIPASSSSDPKVSTGMSPLLLSAASAVEANPLFFAPTAAVPVPGSPVSVDTLAAPSPVLEPAQASVRPAAPPGYKPPSRRRSILDMSQYEKVKTLADASSRLARHFAGNQTSTLLRSETVAVATQEHTTALQHAIVQVVEEARDDKMGNAKGARTWDAARVQNTQREKLKWPRDLTPREMAHQVCSKTHHVMIISVSS